MIWNNSTRQPELSPTVTLLWGSLTFNFDIFIIQFRKKLSKQNMKKTFRENVFICEDFSLSRKENELRRKDRVLGGSTEKILHPPVLEIEQNDGSIGFSTTQSV